MDKTTEILTSEGWKGIGSIKIGDSVYSFKDGEIQKDVSLEVFRTRFSGEMIGIKNSNTDILFTPSRDIIYQLKNCRNGKYGKWLRKRADGFLDYKAQARIPLAGVINSEYSLSDDEISLAGWLIAEGHFRHAGKQKGPGIDIYQKNKEKAELIRGILDRLQYSYSSWIRSDGLTQFHIRKKSSLVVKKYIQSKQIPDWAFDLSKRQFDIMFESMVLGDGHKKNNFSGTYYSASEGLIDKLQAALCIHGYRTRKFFKKGGFKNGGFVLNYCTRQTTDVVFFSNKPRLEPYEDEVWGIKTKNETCVARRNGYAFIA